VLFSQFAKTNLKQELEVGTPGKFTFEPQAEQKLCGICSWKELHP
jgi:hypothetical protein